MALRDCATAFEQVRGEQPGDEVERDDLVARADLPRVFRGERDLAMIVLGPVVETQDLAWAGKAWALAAPLASRRSMSAAA